MNQQFCQAFLNFINTLDSQIWVNIQNNYFLSYQTLSQDEILMKHVWNLKKYLITQKLTTWNEYVNEIKRITKLFLDDNKNLPYFLFSSLLLRLFSNLVSHCETNLIYLSKNHEELVTYLRKKTLANKNS